MGQVISLLFGCLLPSKGSKRRESTSKEEYEQLIISTDQQEAAAPAAALDHYIDIHHDNFILEPTPKKEVREATSPTHIQDDHKEEQKLLKQKKLTNLKASAKGTTVINSTLITSSSSSSSSSGVDTVIRRIGQYSSSQRILLVGEGDFSFSTTLALAFGFAPNIVATSLNSKKFLIENYTRFPNNKMELENRGCMILHGVDATKMAAHPKLHAMKFNRIVFNFPHAGCFGIDTSDMGPHQTLVSGFLRNAKKMIEEDGEIHVTHKSNGFFLKWNIPKLAADQGLFLIQEIKFKLGKYPGYNPKYGFGGDKDFDCNPSKTYKFALASK